MTQKVNKLSENHLKILAIFTKGFDKEYYIREVQKILKISTRTAQIILNDLEKRNILESTTRGKIKLYRLVPSLITKEYITLTESYKTITFLENNPLIKEIIDKIRHSLKGIILIFGSYAKGIQKKDSDLDLLIIGSHDPKTIKQFSKLYGIEINTKQYPLTIFKKAMKEDILLKEVINNHILIKGKDEFINEVLK